MYVRMYIHTRKEGSPFFQSLESWPYLCNPFMSFAIIRFRYITCSYWSSHSLLLFAGRLTFTILPSSFPRRHPQSEPHFLPLPLLSLWAASCFNIFLTDGLGLFSYCAHSSISISLLLFGQSHESLRSLLRLFSALGQFDGGVSINTPRSGDHYWKSHMEGIQWTAHVLSFPRDCAKLMGSYLCRLVMW